MSILVYLAPESTPNALKFTAQALKLGISMKKGLHWASVVRGLDQRMKSCRNKYPCYKSSSAINLLNI